MKRFQQFSEEKNLLYIIFIIQLPAPYSSPTLGVKAIILKFQYDVTVSEPFRNFRRVIFKVFSSTYFIYEL